MQKTRELPLSGDPVKAIEVRAHRQTPHDTQPTDVLRHLIVERNLTADSRLMGSLHGGHRGQGDDGQSDCQDAADDYGCEPYGRCGGDRSTEIRRSAYLDGCRCQPARVRQSCQTVTCFLTACAPVTRLRPTVRRSGYPELDTCR